MNSEDGEEGESEFAGGANSMAPKACFTVLRRFYSEKMNSVEQVMREFLSITGNFKSNRFDQINEH